MLKNITTLILGLSLTLCIIFLAGCASKTTVDNASKPAAIVASNTSSVNSSKLNNSTPVKVSAILIQKSVKQGTKEEIKLLSVDSTLNSMSNFTVTNNSGIK